MGFEIMGRINMITIVLYSIPALSITLPHRKPLFVDIHLMYLSEQISVATLARRLTNLEQQHISLAHRVFNELTSTAQTIQNSSLIKFKSETADFVTIILNSTIS